MPLENYTTYDKLDASGVLTVNATRIDFTKMELSNLSHVTYDYGPDYFEDFTHQVKVVIASAVPNMKTWFWGVSPATSFTHDAHENVEKGQLAGIVRAATSLIIGLTDYEADNSGIVYHTYAENFTRWVEIERAATVLTAKIYTDEYVSLEDTLTVPCTTTKHRYAIALSSTEYVSVPGPRWATGYVANLDLNSTRAPIVISTMRKKNFLVTDKVTINMTSRPSTGMGTE